MASVLPGQAPTRLRPVQLGVVASILLLAAAGWVLTDDRMAGMDAGPGTDLGGIGWFTGIWVTMMAAMMLPSFAPMVVAYARAGSAGESVLFVAGYLVPWAAAGLLGYAVIEGVRGLDPAFLAWGELGPYVAGGVIAAAAAYQLTPLKDRCLRRCTTPQAIVDRERGAGGALRTGVELGWYCVGCCWALMAVLFALGVMSIGWMLVVAGLIAAEKLSPWKKAAGLAIAISLVALAAAVAFVPGDVPLLTVPDSQAGMEMM
jgi:predicted metal-binding membrane protein